LKEGEERGRGRGRGSGGRMLFYIATFEVHAAVLIMKEVL
jgi:hypothetical protein